MTLKKTLTLFAISTMGNGCIGSHSHDSGAHQDSGHAGHTETCGETGEIYTAGMSHTGDLKAIEFVLLSSEPAPPDKGENVFTVSISDLASGIGIDGATVMITPFMPEHGHGSTPAEFIADPTGDTATYQSKTINLFMGGLWDLTFSAASGDAVLDETTFTFCLEG